MKRKSLAALITCLFAVGFVGCSKKNDDNKKTTTKTTSKTTNKTANKTTKTPPTSTAYEGVDKVANAGGIKLTVMYKGKKQSATLKMDKDTHVCKGGSGNDETIRVKNGLLQNAVVRLVGIKTGKKWAAEEITVDNRGCMFRPRISVGKYKGTLKATNSDAVLHNTNLFLQQNNRVLGNLALKKGTSDTAKLKKKGIIAIKCDVHSWMKAYVFSSPHPYAAVTKEDGTATLDNVPAGEYEVKGWHEVFGEVSGKAKVEAGKTVAVTLEFK